MALSKTVAGEWTGQTSAKFTTCKRYIEPPIPEQKDHPLFSMGSKRHYDKKGSEEWQYRPCHTKVPQPDRENQK